MARLVEFDVARGADGKIAVWKWDRICVPSGKPDQKDGMETEFTVETMSQMVDNFVERGDLIPVDFNHQTNYASQNGQPAPALAWYGALAIVEGGQVIRHGCARGVADPPPNGMLHGVGDGLWGLRVEVTELGEGLLPNFKYLSPTFTPEGTKRDGSPCGYALIAVAATNSPFQEGTQISFQKPSGADPEAHKESTMKMSPEMMAKLGLAEDATAEEAYAALAKHFEDSEKEKAEMSAKLAKHEEDAAKMAADADEAAKHESESEEMAKHEADKDDDKKDDAKMAAMQATLDATRARLAKLEKVEAEREKTAKAEQEARCEALANQAYGKENPEARASLLKFARVDFDAAKAMVAHLLPKTGAPAYLFERATQNGAPIGKGKDARSEVGPKKPVRKIAMGVAFEEVDGEYADEIRRLAESEDPAEKAKVDKLLPEARRTQKFDRLLAAGKIVRAERPELASE